MPRTWKSASGVEYVHETLVEQFGNGTSHGVLDGCEPTFSGTNLDVSVAPGNIVFDGSRVAVPGSTVTLVPDGTDPLWAWVLLSSSGAATIRSGSAAPNPLVPSLSASQPPPAVEIALVRVEPNQTRAAACAVKMDKRLFIPRIVTVTATGGGAASAILSADVATPFVFTDVPDFNVPVAANSKGAFQGFIHYTASVADGYSFRLTGPGKISMQLRATLLSGATQSGFISGNGNVGAQVAGFGLTTPGVIQFSGYITTTADGVLQYQHGSASAGATKAQSRLEIL